MIFPLVFAASSPTFYFRTGPNISGCPNVPNLNDGNSYGPCNGGQGSKYGPNSKYWVAINGASSHCGSTIVASYAGKQLELVVMDECPACAATNHIDMSLDALIELTGSKQIACAIDRAPPVIDWWFASGKRVESPQSTSLAPKPSALKLNSTVTATSTTKTSTFVSSRSTSTFAATTTIAKDPVSTWPKPSVTSTSLVNLIPSAGEVTKMSIFQVIFLLVQ